MTVAALCAWAPVALASDGSPERNLATLHELLTVPEAQVDFARTKLTVDAMVDSTIDVQGTMAALDRMTTEVRQKAGPAASSRELLTALRDYLYEAGAWNDFKPFTYDLDDPLGSKVANKILANFLKTRRGNCVSMPLLYLIIADRLKLDAAVAIAPSHLFIKYTDGGSGRVFNLETTSGAHVTRDEWYRENLPMTDLAVSKGTYMRGLSRRETAAVMAELLVEHYQEAGQSREVIAAANEILGAYPDFADVIVARGSAHGRLLEKEFQQKYPSLDQVPPAARAQYHALAAANEADFEHARTLGWQEPK